MILSIIVAVAENGIIGRENQLIWHISEDLKRFKRLTEGHPVVMGRKTFESLGRPLPKRENVVITRQKDLLLEGCRVVNSLEEAFAKYRDTDEEVFVIGGAQIYAEALPFADKFYLTRVHHAYQGDTSFPEWEQTKWNLTEEEHFEAGANYPYPYSFLTYCRKEH